MEIVDIPVEKQCTISTCKHQTTHTNDGHQCRLCFRYGHGYGECTIVEPSKILETFPVKDVENFYIKKYTGMGCYLYVRYENMAKCTGTFSMNGDDWGQYGVTKVPELKDFLSGYQPLREVDTI